MSVSRRVAPRFPDAAAGGRDALRLWPLVLAGWIVASVAFLPARLLVDAALAPLDRLPVSIADAECDAWLTVVPELAGDIRPLTSAVAAGAVLSWLWGVFWRASVVGWKLAADGPRPGMGKLLRLGRRLFGRLLRLALTSALAIAAGLAVVWAPAGIVLAATGEPPPAARLWMVVVLGGLGTLAIVALVAVASLRGAWLLGRADRHSAVAAWLSGFDGAVRQPMQSLAVLLVWWLPPATTAALVVVVAWLTPGIGSGLAMGALLQLSLLVRSHCRVALLASFAPTAGVPAGDR